jgi:dipeptidyl aminopeptidase
MKYPKPGYANPIVSVHVFDLAGYLGASGAVGFPAAEWTHELDWKGRHPAENSIVSEVVWVANGTLILKEVNRNADDGSVVLFELSVSGADVAARAKGHVVRKLGKNGEEGDDGWIESVRTTFPDCESRYALTCIIVTIDADHHPAAGEPVALRRRGVPRHRA